MGASFDHGDDGNLHLAREGGHSHCRIVHAADMTGREIERALLKAVDDNPNIFMFGHHFAIDLLTTQVLNSAPCFYHPLPSTFVLSDATRPVAYLSAITLLCRSYIKFCWQHVQ